jgi:hypothetical protein
MGIKLDPAEPCTTDLAQSLHDPSRPQRLTREELMEGSFFEIPAVHEAGRAMLCAIFNERVESVEIGGQPHCRESAAEEIASGVGLQASGEEARRARREAMICCAGDIAAHLHLDRQLRKCGLAGKPTIQLAASIAAAQAAVRTQELGSYIEGFLEETRAELDARWLNVERLAAALLRRRSLSADEATSILMSSCLHA